MWERVFPCGIATEIKIENLIFYLKTVIVSALAIYFSDAFLLIAFQAWHSLIANIPPNLVDGRQQKLKAATSEKMKKISTDILHLGLTALLAPVGKDPVIKPDAFTAYFWKLPCSSEVKFHFRGSRLC